MTPIKDVMTLATDTILDHAMIDKILCICIVHRPVLRRPLTHNRSPTLRQPQRFLARPCPPTQQAQGIRWHASYQEGGVTISCKSETTADLGFPQLLHYNPEDALPVSKFQLSTLPEAEPTMFVE
jgi:hypothetical protein